MDQCEALPPCEDFEEKAMLPVEGYCAEKDELFAMMMYKKEESDAKQSTLDEAIARSLYEEEERSLLFATTPEDRLEGEVYEDGYEIVETKAPPQCTCCLEGITDANTRRILPCGHMYCIKCIQTRCKIGLRDRSVLPAHCCKVEFPIDFVRQALTAQETRTYEQYMMEKNWKTFDLQSDKRYAETVKRQGGQQCPGCGIGVQRESGCNRMRCFNGHEFCYQCTRKWKTCTCPYN